jgi:ribosomal RNA methyltransferase Nop2
MDGFYVAKFKVEKRKKPVAATKEEEEAPQMKLNEEGELVEEKRTAFNEDEDEEIIRGMSSSFLTRSEWQLTTPDNKRKHLLKTKGIKLAPRSEKSSKVGKSKSK